MFLRFGQDLIDCVSKPSPVTPELGKGRESRRGERVVLAGSGRTVLSPCRGDKTGIVETPQQRVHCSLARYESVVAGERLDELESIHLGGREK